jgi:plasmid maintenance system antidote protein VapI
LKIAKLFGSSAEMWMRLQAAYDLQRAAEDKEVMDLVASIVPVRRA